MVDFKEVSNSAKLGIGHMNGVGELLNHHARDGQECQY